VATTHNAVRSPQRHALICKELEAQKADVIFLQEATVDAVSHILKISSVLSGEYYN
jgi:mRNA deadenylase 3'-5' endonuclease subunit Ccr4